MNVKVSGSNLTYFVIIPKTLSRAFISLNSEKYPLALSSCALGCSADCCGSSWIKFVNWTKSRLRSGENEVREQKSVHSFKGLLVSALKKEKHSLIVFKGFSLFTDKWTLVQGSGEPEGQNVPSGFGFASESFLIPLDYHHIKTSACLLVVCCSNTTPPLPGQMSQWLRTTRESPSKNSWIHPTTQHFHA